MYLYRVGWDTKVSKLIIVAEPSPGDFASCAVPTMQPEATRFSTMNGCPSASDTLGVFFFSSRRRHTRCSRDWSSDVCSSDLCGSGRKYKRCCGAEPSIAAGAVATEPPLGGRGAMERAMAEVGRLLADREFGSIEEMNAYLERALADPGRAAPPPRTPIERAQELIYQAWEARGGRRVRLARQALALWPDCADAYCLLAEETATTLQEARDLYAQALAAGERALGRERL